MNLHKINIAATFFAALALTVIFPALIPKLRVQFFAPFIVILFYRKPIDKCLWASFGCGLILDLLSSYDHLGLTAIAFTLTTWALHRQRRNFFADSLMTLPIMTFLYSSVSTAMQALILTGFGHKVSIDKQWIFTDLTLLPALDALFAFALFVLPAYVFSKPILKGKDYFMNEEEGGDAAVE